ncbi:MAG: hypothetical protein ACFNWW_07855 [Negativicutes bacterium]|jgi:hypothetical protein
MKVERKANHAALARLSRQMANASGEAEFRKIFLAMADREEAIDNLEKATERLEAADIDDKAIVKRRRFLPDGTIEITELQGNKVISRYKKRPPMHFVPDFSRPLKANGKPQMKSVPRLNLLDLLS